MNHVIDLNAEMDIKSNSCSSTPLALAFSRQNCVRHVNGMPKQTNHMSKGLPYSPHSAIKS